MYSLCQQKLTDFNLSKDPGFVWCANQVCSQSHFHPHTPSSFLSQLPVCSSCFGGVCVLSVSTLGVGFQFPHQITCCFLFLPLLLLLILPPSFPNGLLPHRNASLDSLLMWVTELTSFTQSAHLANSRCVSSANDRSV